MTTDKVTKTGTTPEVEEGLERGEILGTLPLIWQGMVHIRDGYGKEFTKFAYVFENGDVYFSRDEKDFIPAQKWARAALKKKLYSVGVSFK